MYMLKIYWSFSIQINCHKKTLFNKSDLFYLTNLIFFTFVYRNHFVWRVIHFGFRISSSLPELGTNLW